VTRRVANQSIPVASQANPPHACRDPRPEWSELISRIRRGDPGAQETLYELLHQGVRFFLLRHLGPEGLDELHEVFLIVVKAIQAGAVREPDRLPGFVTGVVKRRIALFVRRSVQRRKMVCGSMPSDLSGATLSVEEALYLAQKKEAMEKILDALSPRDREVLVRFYLREESAETICSDLGLSTTQFRLLKSRAKARFAELGRRKQRQEALAAYVRRAMAVKTGG